MPWLSLPYVKFDLPPTDPFPNGLIAWRPNLFVKLIAPTGKEFYCIACADTGADQCVFPVSFTGPLGLDPLSMPKNMTAGVGSTANVTYYADLSIDLCLNPISPIEITTRVGFTAGLEAQGIGLLGQRGFFDTFDVVFSHQKKTFLIGVPDTPQPQSSK